MPKLSTEYLTRLKGMVEDLHGRMAKKKALPALPSDPTARSQELKDVAERLHRARKLSEMADKEYGSPYSPVKTPGFKKGGLYSFRELMDLASAKMTSEQELRMLNDMLDKGEPIPFELSEKIKERLAKGRKLNSPKYNTLYEKEMGWNPDVTAADFWNMSQSMFPGLDPAHSAVADILWDKYKAPLPREMKLKRSLAVPWHEELPEGFQMDQRTIAATSLDPDVAKGYAIARPEDELLGKTTGGKPWPRIMLDINTPPGMEVLPRPSMLQDEFLLPPDLIFEVSGKPTLVEPSKLITPEARGRFPRVIKYPVEARKRRGFAAGGDVDYLHYGMGPEHKFFADDRFEPLAPSTPAATPTVSPPFRVGSGSGNSVGRTLGTVAGVGALGYAGKKLYDNYFQGKTPQWIENITDNPLVDKLKDVFKGGKGAANLYIGTQQGGLGGAGTALSGAGDLAKLGGKYNLGTGTYGSYLSGAGDILSGIDQGGVKGYGKAASGALNLADALGANTGALGSYVPVVGGLYNLANADFSNPGSVTGALGSAATAASSAGLGGAAAAGTLGALSTAMPLAAAGFAIADLANAALNKHDVEYAKYAQNMGFKPIQVGEGKKGAKGQIFGRQTYYVMDNGKIISPKDMEWLARQSRPTGRGNQAVDDAYRKKVDDLRAADWRSPHINAKEYDTIQKWLDQKYAGSGYHIAEGGAVNKAEGGPMRGAFSRLMAQMPQRQEDTSYYTYGTPQRQASVVRVPQLSPLQRAMGGGASFGYNQGGDPNLVKGPGSGRSDDIPARLSDGEYVWDAETVALLGDGSTDEGARRLDALRKKLRMHKGKNLAKGKFSKKAKLPEKYLE